MIFLMCTSGRLNAGVYPDMILVNGRIITVDKHFSVAEAVAIQDDRFIAVGTTADVAKLAGPSTMRIDLKGKTVIPGLIDFHLHPETACLSERVEEIPDVHTMDDL